MGDTGAFTLTPNLAERVWGGNRLGSGIGEAWDLSTHPNGPSLIASGPHQGTTLAELASEVPDDFGGPIELLAKRLDCADNLSVQVHPSTGDPKTEAWVVLDADPGAGVYLGFTGEPTAEEIRSAALDGSLPELLHFVELSVGDAVYVPAGTVHAIGAGLMLFELQQSSDTTYRLFDWGRTGRELHLDAGLACSVLGPAPARPEPVALPDGAVRLVESPFFVIDRVEPVGPLPVDPGDHWIAIHIIAGSATIAGLEVGAGETVVVPRSAGALMLDPSSGFRGLRYGPSDATR